MSSVKLSALLLGTALFVGMGATTLSADMKCGAGKCGSNMKMDNKEKMKEGKCGDAKKRMMKKEGKCGDAKCGDAKKSMMKKEGKCGGSNN